MATHIHIHVTDSKKANTKDAFGDPIPMPNEAKSLLEKFKQEMKSADVKQSYIDKCVAELKNVYNPSKALEGKRSGGFKSTPASLLNPFKDMIHHSVRQGKESSFLKNSSGR